jgi:taurine dioxygenase
VFESQDRPDCASLRPSYDAENLSPEESMSSLASKQGPRYRHAADETEPYETIAVEKLTPIIGAEISGVDLAATLSNRTMDEIHRALAENIVIFFRDQHITPQQHLAFGRQFGELLSIPQPPMRATIRP